MSRSITMRIILAMTLVLGAAACGSDEPDGYDPGADATSPDAGGTDANNLPEDTGSEPTEPDIEEPDTTPTEPDTTPTEPDVVQPDVTEPDVTEPDVIEPDVTEPDVTDPDVTEPDVEEPDVTPGDSAVGDLLAEFDGQDNDFQTTPDITLEDLVVTVIKPDVGTELGGFFAVEPGSLNSIYFAPENGEADLPADLEQGSVIDVHLDELTLVDGMVMVTGYSDLTITDEVDSVSPYLSDASDWSLSDWEDTQATFIELEGMIEGDSAAAGGGAWRRFEFISDGINDGSDTVQLRLTSETIEYFGIEDGCAFSLSHGAVWAYRGGDASTPTQYQPMFTDHEHFVLGCEAPQLTDAKSPDDNTVILSFTRPMDLATMTLDAFEFTPALEVTDVELSNDLKTATLTTVDQDAQEDYIITIQDTVRDTTGEQLDPDHMDSVVERVESTYLAILYCFGDDSGNLVPTPTVVAQGFTDVSDTTRPDGTAVTSPAGNGRNMPDECPDGGANKSFSSNAWSEEGDFDPDSPAYLTFSFKAPAGTAYVQFDAQRSNTGPDKFAVWESVSDSVLAQDIPTPTRFDAYPMFPSGDDLWAIDIPDGYDDPIEVRIYPYNTSGSGGTFRVDNLTVQFAPAP